MLERLGYVYGSIYYRAAAYFVASVGKASVLGVILFHVVIVFSIEFNRNIKAHKKKNNTELALSKNALKIN